MSNQHFVTTVALRLALEALNDIIPANANIEEVRHKQRKASAALREALAEQREVKDVVIDNMGDPFIVKAYVTPQPAQQEPVAWQWRRKDQPWSLEYTFNSEVHVTTKDSERRALYTSPPQRKPLTDEQIKDAVRGAGLSFTAPDFKVARAIEAAHGIKENT